MCSPVMPKKADPNSGDAPGHLLAQSAGSCDGLSPSPIRWFHSNKCSTMNAAPPSMVARIHLRAAERSRLVEAETAITIVKLLDSRHSVITVENVMLGWNGNGVGQFTLA